MADLFKEAKEVVEATVSRSLEFEGQGTVQQIKERLALYETLRMQATTIKDKKFWSEKIGVRASYDFYMSELPGAKILGAYRGKGVFDLVFAVQWEGAEYLIIVEAKAGLSARLISRIFEGAPVMQGDEKYLRSIVKAMADRNQRGNIKNYSSIQPNKLGVLSERISNALREGRVLYCAGYQSVNKDGSLSKFFQGIFSESSRLRTIYFEKTFRELAAKKTLTDSDKAKFGKLVTEYNEFNSKVKTPAKDPMVEQKASIKVSLFKLTGRFQLSNSLTYYTEKPSVNFPRYTGPSPSRAGNAMGAGLGLLELIKVAIELYSNIKQDIAISDQKTFKKLLEGRYQLWIYLLMGSAPPYIHLMDYRGNLVVANATKEEKYSLLPLGDGKALKDSPFTKDFNPIVAADIRDVANLVAAMERKARTMTLTEFHQLIYYKLDPRQQWSQKMVFFKNYDYSKNTFSANWSIRIWRDDGYVEESLDKYDARLNKMYNLMINNQKTFLAKQRKELARKDMTCWYYTNALKLKSLTIKKGEPIKKFYAVVGNYEPGYQWVVLPLKFETWLQVSNFSLNYLCRNLVLGEPDYYEWSENIEGYCYYND